MGYWPKRMKRRRGKWVKNLGCKLVLLGYTGSQQKRWVADMRVARMLHLRVVYYVERGNEGSAQGYSPFAAMLRMARRQELY